MNIGYARGSTLDQNLDLQMQVLRKAGCKKIFREKVSGASRERPEFQGCSISSGTATRSSCGNSTA
jgi:DNA invertase Pin-like site-specific DNA recombinase